MSSTPATADPAAWPYEPGDVYCSRLSWSVGGERNTRSPSEDPMTFPAGAEVEIVAYTRDPESGEEEENCVPRAGSARTYILERLGESDGVLLSLMELRLAQRNARLDAALAKTQPPPAEMACVTGTDECPF